MGHTIMASQTVRKLGAGKRVYAKRPDALDDASDNESDRLSRDSSPSPETPSLCWDSDPELTQSQSSTSSTHEDEAAVVLASTQPEPETRWLH